MTQPRDYQRSTVNPISTLPAYDGELGARLTADGTAFTVWAPTAEAVTLRLFATGSDDEPGARAIAERPMASGPRGTWHVEIPEWLAGVYYDFLVAFPDGTVNRAADPWARAAGVNGARSMVVDLARTNPDGWDDDRGPDIPDGELVVWETHIGDFSNDPDCGVPAEHRGRFLVPWMRPGPTPTSSTGGTTRSTTTCPKAPTAPTPTTARRGSANARR